MGSILEAKKSNNSLIENKKIMQWRISCNDHHGVFHVLVDDHDEGLEDHEEHEGEDQDDCQDVDDDQWGVAGEKRGCD